MSQIREEKILIGEIIDDPMEQIADGPKATFFPTRFFPEPRVQRSALENWDFFDGALLALHFGSASNQFITGSAILVAPGVALCARHVVEPFLPEIHGGKISLICSAISKSGVVFWKVTEITLTRQTDVAILALRLASRMPNNNEFNLAAISTRLPEVGELVTIAGFVANKEEFRAAPPAPNSIDGNICVAAGPVTQRFELKRDNYLLPWPAIELDCASLGGMSGGPAFDRYGMLVGIVCSGFDTLENNGPVFVSLIWPATAIKISPQWPPGFYTESVSLLDIDNAFCHIDRRDAISVQLDQSTGLSRIEYRKW